jgi:hypothetical protein
MSIKVTVKRKIHSTVWMPAVCRVPVRRTILFIRAPHQSCIIDPIRYPEPKNVVPGECRMPAGNCVNSLFRIYLHVLIILVTNHDGSGGLPLMHDRYVWIPTVYQRGRRNNPLLEGERGTDQNPVSLFLHTPPFRLV